MTMLSHTRAPQNYKRSDPEFVAIAFIASLLRLGCDFFSYAQPFVRSGLTNRRPCSRPSVKPECTSVKCWVDKCHLTKPSSQMNKNGHARLISSLNCAPELTCSGSWTLPLLLSSTFSFFSVRCHSVIKKKSQFHRNSKATNATATSVMLYEVIKTGS